MGRLRSPYRFKPNVKHLIMHTNPLRKTSVRYLCLHASLIICAFLAPLLTVLLTIDAMAAVCESPTFYLSQLIRATSDKGSPLDLISGDLNNDGKVDLIILEQPSTIRTELGLGNLQFITRQVFKFSWPTERVALGDLNGDGILDLVVGGDNRGVVFEGIGDGTFQQRRSFSPPGVGASTIVPFTTLWLEDFNADGRLDIAYSTVRRTPDTVDKGEIRVDISDPSGFQVARSIAPDLRDFEQRSVTFTMVAGHFIEDSPGDLLISQWTGGNDKTYLFQRFRDGFLPYPVFKIESFDRLDNPVLGDFNEDGIVDIIMHDGNGHIVMFKGIRSSTPLSRPPFEVSIPIVPSVAHWTARLTSGDFNGDSHLDIAYVVSHLNRNTVILLLGNGKGQFREASTIELGTFGGSLGAIVALDVDGNGLSDLAVAQVGPIRESQVRVFVNQCPATTGDLKISHIEVTQTIQDLQNSVPLIAGKRTFARVHVDSNVHVAGVDASLTATTASGAPLGPPLVPSNLRRLINITPFPKRVNIDDSFFFELPVEWTKQDGLVLTATVNTNRVIQEGDWDNNRSSTAVLRFERAMIPKVQIVDLLAPSQDCPPNNPNGRNCLSKVWFDQTYLDIVRNLQTQLPVAQIDFERVAYRDDTLNRNYDRSTALQSLERYVMMSGISPSGRFYYGSLQGQSGAAPGRIDWTEGLKAVGDSESAAHEFGHLLTLGHVLGPSKICEVPDRVDSMYPYPNGQIGGPGNVPERFVGWNYSHPAARFPTVPQILWPSDWDTMTYCPRRWFSDWSLGRMRNILNSQVIIGKTESSTRLRSQAVVDLGRNQFLEFWKQLSILQSAEAAPVQESAGRTLLILGTVDLGTQAGLSLEISLQAQSRTSPTLVPGAYRLRLLDKAGVVLSEYSFAPIPMTDHERSVGLIRLEVPFTEDTRQLIISSDFSDQIIFSRTVSVTPPIIRDVTVSKVPMRAGEDLQEVTWQANDPDNDTLTYRVLYSKDNKQTWKLIAANLQDRRFRIPTAHLGQTIDGQESYFRIVANDGVLEASGESTGFQVGNSPPAAVILSPLHGATYQPGQMVTLHGLGQDIEDGTISDEGLQWSSNRDGIIGRGRMVQVQTLTQGKHILTLRVVDSSGRVNEMRTEIHIGDYKAAPLVVTCAFGKGREFVLGGYQPTGQPWTMKVGQILPMVKQGRPAFSEGKGGQLTPITIVRSRQGRDYLRSKPNRTSTDNLLALPICR